MPIPDVTYCYVERRGSDWEAVCLDFDIAVQGQSLHEVQEKLARAVHEYVAYVSTLPEADRERLLNRRVPFWTRLAFMVQVFRTAFLGRHHGSGPNQRGAFTLPCVA